MLQNMQQTSTLSLKHLFNDHDYAWQLLEGEAHLEVSDSVTSEDVSNLLQLYMKGVEKMNSYLDLRESFFKERVIRLMTRPSVMKALNNNQISSRKNIPPVPPMSTQKKVDTKGSKKPEKMISVKRIEAKPQFIQLKQKKIEIEVRLAYELKENTPGILHSLIAQQNKKQDSISLKINKIVENHEDKLLGRIRERREKFTSRCLFNISSKSNRKDLNSKDLFAHRKSDKINNRVFKSCIQKQENSTNTQHKQRGQRLFNSCQRRSWSGIEHEGKNDVELKTLMSFSEQLRKTQGKQKSCPSKQV